MPHKFKSGIAAPKAEKRPLKIQQLGRSRSDDYQWLKDPNWQTVMREPSTLGADIRAYLDAENKHTKSVTENLRDLETEIFEELKNRLDPEDKDVPVPDGKYAYFHAYRKGDQHGYYARQAIDDNRAPLSEAEILLDLDTRAAGSGFYNVGSISHSPDHAHLAFAEDLAGSENYEIFIQSQGGKPVSTGIKMSTGYAVWAADSKTIFWVENDDNHRPSKVYRKDVFAPDSMPHLVYEELDPGFFVSVGKTDSGRFILINAHNHTTSEIWSIPANSPETYPVSFATRQDGHEYDIQDHGDHFYILTNHKGAVDFEICRRIISQSEDSEWEPYLPHQSGTLILAMEMFSGHMVRLVRQNALPRIIIRNLKTDLETELEFDDAAYALGLLDNLEFDTSWLRFSYASPKTPGQVFDYHMTTGERILKKTQNIPSGHDPALYDAERIHIPARDGAEIPVTLLYRKDTPRDGTAPLLLYGYGSYGLTEAARFSTAVFSLVNRGFIYAVAHIRGGMANGYQWYLDGKLEKKTNTFNDFVDVGNALAERQYTARGKIIGFGGSAGGLLVGAAVNQDPQLFGGIIAAVPFVDVLNTMSDDTLPLTPPEWPEWGNPLTDASAYDRIASYSPYDNVQTRDYPPMFITGGLTDPRVTYWEPAKWAAKLRDHQTADAPILLKINMEAGHQGESGRYDRLKETAQEYAFALAAISSPN